MKVNRRTQADRTASTRAALVAAARERFGARGYAAVGTTEIAEAAGVTRGALYHQFADKAALFAAVLEDVETEITSRIVAALGAATGDALQALRTAAMTFLDAAVEPEVRQVVLLDGPVVLGWAAWRDVVARYGLGLTEAALSAGMADGSIREGPVTTLAHLLLGALDEGALLVAAADEPRTTRREVETVVMLLLDALRPDQAVSRGGPT
jgi:AcrR family transcriptional regulator